MLPDYRPQLLDRFGLAVHVSAITDVKQRAEVFNRARSFAANPPKFEKNYHDEQTRIKGRLLQARAKLEKILLPASIVNRTIETILRLGVRTHRAELSTLQGAVARAAWYEREEVLWEDIQNVMPSALQHRLSDSDTQSPVTWDVLDKRLFESNKDPEKTPNTGWFPTPFYRKKKAQEQKIPQN